MWVKVKPIYEYFISNNIDPITAAAICGNIGAESSGDPNATNGTHWGYIQNEKGIVDYIKRNYGGYGHNQQLAFILDGLRGQLKETNTVWGRELVKRFNDFNSQIKNIKTAGEGAYLWEKAYERSGGQANLKRRDYAEYFYTQAKGPQSIYKQQIVQQPDATRVQEKPHIDINYIQSGTNDTSYWFPEQTNLDNYINQWSNNPPNIPYYAMNEAKSGNSFIQPALKQYQNGGKLIKRYSQWISQLKRINK